MALPPMPGSGLLHVTLVELSRVALNVGGWSGPTRWARAAIKTNVRDGFAAGTVTRNVTSVARNAWGRAWGLRSSTSRRSSGRGRPVGTSPGAVRDELRRYLPRLDWPSEYD